MRFADRAQAGMLLARELAAYGDRRDVLVLALPRGGVPVAFAIAETLHAPLDVLQVRKLGVPGEEELALGAIASGGVLVLNPSVVGPLGISRTEIDRVAAIERRELERREHKYRGGRPALAIRGRTILLVDDGMATGSTMRAAVAALRTKAPARLVVAVPVAAPSVCDELRREVDELVCLARPEPFGSVGFWYEDFSQTTDEDVCDLLERAAAFAERRALPEKGP